MIAQWVRLRSLYPFHDFRGISVFLPEVREFNKDTIAFIMQQVHCVLALFSDLKNGIKNRSSKRWMLHKKDHNCAESATHETIEEHCIKIIIHF